MPRKGSIPREIYTSLLCVQYQKASARDSSNVLIKYYLTGYSSLMTELIIFCAKYLVFVEVLAFVLFILFSRARVRIRLFLMSLIALPLAYLGNVLAGYVWYDTRPFVESGLAPLIEHAADNGFPSDHTTLAATLAMLVTLRSPKLGLLFWLATIAIAVARVLSWLHHPVDVLASVAIGTAAAFIAFEIIVWRRLRKSQRVQ